MSSPSGSMRCHRALRPMSTVVMATVVRASVQCSPQLPVTGESSSQDVACREPRTSSIHRRKPFQTEKDDPPVMRWQRVIQFPETAQVVLAINCETVVPLLRRLYVLKSSSRGALAFGLVTAEVAVLCARDTLTCSASFDYRSVRCLARSDVNPTEQVSTRIGSPLPPRLAGQSVEGRAATAAASS